MIFIYFILKKIKRTLFKKINILTTLPSQNHGYLVFAGVLILKVTAYCSYRNAHREHSDSYTSVAESLSYMLCVTHISHLEFHLTAHSKV